MNTRATVAEERVEKREIKETDGGAEEMRRKAKIYKSSVVQAILPSPLYHLHHLHHPLPQRKERNQYTSHLLTYQ